MLISPWSAAVSPNAIPPSTCISTVSGFTTWPESSAHTKRCTARPPSWAIEISATPAMKVLSTCSSARPRNLPAGSGAPHPVDEALLEEAILRVADAAPEADRHMGVGLDEVGPIVRDVVGHVVGEAFLDLPVDTAHEVAGEQRVEDGIAAQPH